MKIMSLGQCSKSDYNLRFLEAIKMPQRTDNPTFSSMGYPKKQDMILYVSACSTKYQTKDKKIITTTDGDVVYVPNGAEYRVDCVEDSQDAATLQINFLLFDEGLEPFTLSDEITVYSPQSSDIKALFEKAILLSKNASVSPTKQKIILFEILDALAEGDDREKPLGVIKAGVEYLNAHYFENPSVAELADLCHVSEEYFRRLFKKQTGVSPNEYKNALRQRKAEQYLLYSDMSIAEISDSLSFATVSHFIKSFKDAYGLSPLAFRNSSKR